MGYFFKRQKKVLQFLMLFKKCYMNQFVNQIKYGWLNSEIFYRSMKSWLHDNDIEMYSTHNEGTFVSERFIRTLRNKIYKYMTSISRNVFEKYIFENVYTPNWSR